MTTALMSRDNPVWVLPEGHDCAIEFWAENKWIRREEYSTVAYLKTVIPSLHNSKAIRIVKVSRYPPHPAQAVLYYREEQDQ